MASPRTPVRLCAALACVGLLGAGASAAVAAAPVPTTPASGAVVDSLRPVFTWTAATRALLRPPVARYELMIAGTPDRKVAEVPVGTLSASPTVDLADESAVQWFVRAVDQGGQAQVSRRVDISVSTRPGPPTIIAGPAGPTRVSAPSFSWSGDRTDSRWSLLTGAGAGVQEGTSGSAGGTAVLTPLADASYVFRVVQRNSRGAEGDAATRAFTVDTAAPAPLVLSAGQPAASPSTTPGFGWQAPEAGATVTWRVLASSGAPVQGPAQALGTVVTAPLAPGSYRFEARQTDGAGNEGPWSGVAFQVTGSGAVPRGGATAITLPARNARLLTPRKGTRLLKVRPTLRWTRGPAGTSVYNVQIFRVVGPGPQLRKVYSVFPRRRALTMPKVARLTPGACYVWRVWPFRGGKFTKTPLGVSNFCVLRRTPAPAGG